MLHTLTATRPTVFSYNIYFSDFVKSMRVVSVIPKVNGRGDVYQFLYCDIDFVPHRPIGQSLLLSLMINARIRHTSGSAFRTTGTTDTP